MKNLGTIALQEQADLEILHPIKAEGLGVYFILAGPSHPDRERFELDKDRKLRTQINKKGSIELEDPEEDRARLVDYLRVCTLGWYTLEKDETGAVTRIDAADFGNGPTPYSTAAARAVYLNKELGWIKDQVRTGLAKNDVFIKDSSRPSSNTAAGSPASPS